MEGKRVVSVKFDSKSKRKGRTLKLGHTKQKHAIWALKRARRSAIRAAKRVVGGRLSIEQVKAALAGL